MIVKHISLWRCSLLTGLIVLGILLLTACGSNPTASKPDKPKASLGSNVVMANAALYHSPAGSADLSWDATTKKLVVKLAVNGLAPKSVYPAHIHNGLCRKAGEIKYALEKLVADVSGVATSETTIENVKEGIPAAAWSIMIHSGANAKPGEQGVAVSCGDLLNVSPKTQTNQQLHIALGAASSPNQQASGVAQLRLVDNTLTVTVTMTGLVPKSHHMTYIYAGACNAQGRIIYPLKPITADAHGNGSSTTFVNGVSGVPPHGWYVNVHMTGASASQSGNEPIACGNIMTAGQ